MNNLKDVFQTSTKTIKEIFGNKDSYYQIPDYQRPYRWNTEQIEDLWDDIYEAWTTNEETYFLGPIVLAPGEDGRLDVIDGQQRLTSLTILFCVIRDLHLRRNMPLIDLIQSVVDKKYRLRLVTQSQYQGKFESEVLKRVKFPKTIVSRKDRERDPLLNAVWIFREKTRSLRRKKDIELFLDYLMSHVIMISIICSNMALAIKLFQNLNTKGLELSNVDVVKSDLFRRCSKEKRKELNSTWIKLQNLSEYVEEDLDNLLTFYGYSFLERKPRGSLAAELTDHPNFKKRDPTSIAYELLKFSESYKFLCDIQDKLYFSFWYLPNDIYWKTILTLAHLEEYSEIRSLAFLLRKLFWGYWLAGHNVSKIKPLALQLIHWVKKNKPISFIESQINQKIRSDGIGQEIKKHLTDDVDDQRWIKPLLILVEYNRTDNSKMTWIEIDRTLQLEHVLPVKWSSQRMWKKYWDYPQADNWLGTIGNLTLLSGSKNVAASNLAFSEKKKVYNKAHGGKTAFEISKEIADYKTWTEKEVEERQNQIVQEVLGLLGYSKRRAIP